VGTFGSVYEATLCRPFGLRLPVALKVLRPDLSPTLVRRFRDEARLMGLLQHASIVRVFELGELPDGRWFVAMERVDGTDLEWIGEQCGALPPPVVWHVGTQVACALDYAWSHTPDGGQPLGLEHRDIKPPNILITPRGRVKVLDFGLARARFPTREARTLVGGAFGTVPYMSPDRWTGVNDPSNDVFALGATLAQLLAGSQPTGETSFAIQQSWRKHCLDVAEANTSPEAGALLRAMCHPRSNKRPTAAEVRESLRVLRNRDDPMPWFHRSVPLVAEARVVKDGPLSHRRVRPIAAGSPVDDEMGTLTPPIPRSRAGGASFRLAVPLALAVGLLASSLLVNLAMLVLLAWFALG
jgi:serine/threonine protein kinase